MKRTVTLVFLISFCTLFIASICTGKAEKAPAVLKLDSLADKYEPVTFNHTKHIFMSQGCGTCHHQHGSNASSCKGCHSVSSSIFKKSVVNTFMACRTCHTIYDPANPNMPGLKVAYHRTCFQCHKGMNGVGTDPKGCTETCHAKQKMKARK